MIITDIEEKTIYIVNNISSLQDTERLLRNRQDKIDKLLIKRHTLSKKRIKGLEVLKNRYLEKEMLCRLSLRLLKKTINF